MKVSRRDFLLLSAAACAWALTGCSRAVRAQDETAVSVQSAQPYTKASDTEAGPDADAPSPEPMQASTFGPGVQVPAYFELPLEGATGFVGAAVLALCAQAAESSTVLRTLRAGDMFYIRQEAGDYWQVCILDGTVGWLKSSVCMINLPDVLPSVVYQNPNVTASIFRTLGQEIEGVTGCQLYEGYCYNPRLAREEYIMPMNYRMAKKVGNAQSLALQAGDCLKIIETFRPYEVQMQVRDALYEKAYADKEVLAALNTSPWNIGWFIATSLSNHQRGVAMDVTLLRVTSSQMHSVGGCTFLRADGDEYEMPSAMHELSRAAACFTKPVASGSKTSWQSAERAETMTDGALRLQSYCTQADLTPLASEWWHFNDLDAQSAVSATSGNGKFWLDGCISFVPGE